MTRTFINPALSPGLTTFASPANILDNGGFEIWQRGTLFSSPANGAYLADRWLVTHITPNPTYTVSQNGSIVDTGLYSMEINITNFNSTPFIQFLQYVESYIAYAGMTITLSMRVWSNIAGANIELADYAAHFAESSAHPGDSQWHTLTCTLTCGGSAQMQFLFAAFNPPAANGTHYIDSAILIVGATAANFTATNPQVDLQRCERYYCSGITEISAVGRTGVSSYSLEQSESFPSTMRVNPTMTFTSPTVWEQGANTNVSGSYTIVAAGATGGDQYYTTFTVTASKSISGAIPSFLSGNWVASADL